MLSTKDVRMFKSQRRGRNLTWFATVKMEELDVQQEQEEEVAWVRDAFKKA